MRRERHREVMMPVAVRGVAVTKKKSQEELDDENKAKSNNGQVYSLRHSSVILLTAWHVKSRRLL